MLSKTGFPLVSLLLLAPTASGEYVQPSAFTAAEPSRCHLQSSITYFDQWGPLFTENRYSCSFSGSSPQPTNPLESFRVPAPYDHPAGDQGSDYRVVQTGAMISEEDAYNQLLQSSLTKHSVIDYGCTPLEDSKPLSRNKYSNLFWAMGQLTNQSCLDPGEAVEYVDFRRDWTADWRFTNVNRGKIRICDWYAELSNVAKALHYFCFHTLGRSADDEYSGGEEIVAFGRDKDQSQLWCMRYSKKGWNSVEFEHKCLGI